MQLKLNSGGSGYLSDVIAGIQWSVNNGIDVISMSLGSDVGSRSLKKHVVMHTVRESY